MNYTLISLKFISKSVVKYKSPDFPPSSEYLVSVYLGALSIADIPFDLNKKDFKDLIHFFEMNPFLKISNDFYSSSLIQKKYLYKKIYYNYSRNRWRISNWITYNLFKFQITIKSDFISCFVVILKKLLKNIFALKTDIMRFILILISIYLKLI